MALLSKKLDKNWADVVIHEEVRLLLAVISDLHEKGRELGREIKGNEYESKDDFFKEHDSGKSGLVQLEGVSDREGDMFVLRDCPMSALLSSTAINGRMPEHYGRIVEKWKSTYKKKGAILSPFCIVHQVIRETVGEQIYVKGRQMHITQIACRNMKNGEVAFAEEGMSRLGLKEEDVKRQLSGKACMYAIF